MSRPESQHTGVLKIGIVADDLTGACDSGVEFLRCSESVTVLVGRDTPSEADDLEGIVVHNTQSRNLSPKDAYDAVFEATRRCLWAGRDLVLKKVDSALRGNFGVEIAAVMDAAKARVAFVLPAIPEAGRTTIGGVQHIGGVPIAESFYANDPEHPVTESSVLAQAEAGSGRKAGLISLEDVRTGKTAEVAHRLQDRGAAIIVVDARLDRDLQNAVRDLMEPRQEAVFVGCQGLAETLAGLFPKVNKRHHAPSSLKSPALFICGTLHPRSRRQLEVGARARQLVLLEVDSNRILEPYTGKGVLTEMVSKCRDTASAAQNIGIRIRKTGAKPPAKCCERILAFLSDVCREIVTSVDVGTLVLTGGETAYSICYSLGVRALKLHARIAPLVVACEAVGGPCDGKTFVLKGGSIGPEDLVSRIHRFLYTGK